MSENRYRLIKLYIRNLSLESPLTGRMPSQVNNPVIDIEIDPEINRITDAQYEVAARFTISARIGKTPLFLLQLTQAGFFSILPRGEQSKDELLRRVFPQVIFPAVRNNIASLSMTAGYQSIIVDHVVLESIFQNIPVTDKRQPQALPAALTPPSRLYMPPPLAVPQPEAVRPEPQEEMPIAEIGGTAKQRRSPALLGGTRVALGVFLVVAALALWYMGSQPERTLQQDEPVVVAKVAPSAAVELPAVDDLGNASLVQELEHLGADWMVSQLDGDFSVELLRTADLDKALSQPSPENGQPVFLFKLPGGEKPDYVVLSGAYPEEELALKVAQGVAGSRVVRLGEYRNSGG